MAIRRISFVFTGFLGAFLGIAGCTQEVDNAESSSSALDPAGSEAAKAMGGPVFADLFAVGGPGEGAATGPTAGETPRPPMTRLPFDLPKPPAPVEGAEPTGGTEPEVPPCVINDAPKDPPAGPSGEAPKDAPKEPGKTGPEGGAEGGAAGKGPASKDDKKPVNPLVAITGGGATAGTSLQLEDIKLKTGSDLVLTFNPPPPPAPPTRSADESTEGSKPDGAKPKGPGGISALQIAFFAHLPAPSEKPPVADGAATGEPSGAKPTDKMPPGGPKMGPKPDAILTCYGKVTEGRGTITVSHTALDGLLARFGEKDAVARIALAHFAAPPPPMKAGEKPPVGSDGPPPGASSGEPGSGSGGGADGKRPPPPVGRGVFTLIALQDGVKMSDLVKAPK